MGDHPASWDVYFVSDDVEATVKTAIEAGGRALREPFDVPGARMAVLQDPLGAVFEIIKMEASST
jgi:predicted enzyme related to lactoylglutathione lyase